MAASSRWATSACRRPRSRGWTSARPWSASARTARTSASASSADVGDALRGSELRVFESVLDGAAALPLRRAAPRRATNDLDLDGLARLGGGYFMARLAEPAVIVDPERKVLRAHREPDRRAGSRAAEGGRLRSRSRAAYLAEREVARGTPARRTRSTTRSSAPFKDRARAPAELDRAGRANAHHKRPTTTRSAATSGSRPARSRPRRPGRPRRRIERLDVVDEPRKEWDLRMTIAAGAALGHRGGVGHRGRRATSCVTLGPVDAAGGLGRPRRDHRSRTAEARPALLGALLGAIRGRGWWPGCLARRIARVKPSSSVSSGPDDLAGAVQGDQQAATPWA